MRSVIVTSRKLQLAIRAEGNGPCVVLSSISGKIDICTLVEHR